MKKTFNYSEVKENNSYVRRDLVSEQNIKDTKKNKIIINDKKPKNRDQKSEDNYHCSDYFLG